MLDTALSAAKRRATADRSKSNRSSVTNGRRDFVEADGRSAWARRFRDLCGIYAAHIGGAPTPPQESLIRRIAALDVESEKMEGALAEGRKDDVDLELYNRVAGTMRRLLADLGFESSKRDITPNPLADHFARPVGKP